MVMLTTLSLFAVPASARPAEAATTGPIHLPEAYDPSRSLAPLVKAVAPAVVTIEVEKSGFEHPQLPPWFRQFGLDPEELPDVVSGEGSGFVISADGLVLTNHHVIAQATEIKAVLDDGTEVPAKVLGGDAAMDVALLRLEGERSWPYLELGDSERLEVGDWVVAMGDALGLGTTATVGIVSGKGRVIGQDLFGRESFIQTDAAINQGNSGGPLFDLQGRVVGMSTAIIAGANTVGFAIPSSLLSDILPDLQRLGHVARGYLGVMPQTLDPELREAFGVEAEKGALVTRVDEGTPAAKAGLEAGDVVVRVDGAEIASDRDLVRVIGNRSPGDRVTLEIERGSKPKKLEVVLAERPTEDTLARAEAERSEPAADGQIAGLGLQLAPLSPAVAAEAGVKAGVLVERVERGSPADGRLEPGDVIVEVNRHPVAKPEDVERHLARASGTAFVLVLRDDAQQFVAIPTP